MNVVITGASGGIGYEVALQMAAAGHAVLAIARRREQLEKLKAAILASYPDSKIFVLAGDLSDKDFPEQAAKEIRTHLKSVNILINNAGRLINKPFEELTSKDWKEVYETNVFSVVELVKSLLPLFPSGTRNHILNISSMGGFQGSMKFKGLSAYSSSKAALAGITECLAEEFKEKNIAVNCLCLGSVQTEMFSNAFPSYAAALTPAEAGKFISSFALEGATLFNGKIIPVSSTTP
jgi:3-oxoacyl-[acyl-carrier protein] reductase